MFTTFKLIFTAELLDVPLLLFVHYYLALLVHGPYSHHQPRYLYQILR